MRFLGGKARVAKPLTNFLKSVRKSNQIYVEPCIGGGSIIRHMANPRIASDISLDLILFYKELQNGWIPPEHMSEDEYKQLKCVEPSAIRGFGGYFCSFGGKWFGGYAREKDRDFCLGAYRDSLKLSEQIKGVDLHCCDYEELLKIHLKIFADVNVRCLIYIDPPYKNTTKYSETFDHNRFWEIIRQFSNIHDIYVSEYEAPEDFKCVWSIVRKAELNTKHGKAIRIERLFKFKGEKCDHSQ